MRDSVTPVMRVFFNASWSGDRIIGVENTSRLDDKSMNVPALGKILQRVRPRPPHRNRRRKHYLLIAFVIRAAYTSTEGGWPDRPGFLGALEPYENNKWFPWGYRSLLRWRLQ